MPQVKSTYSDPKDFGTFGRFKETPVAEMNPAMKDAFDFTKNLRQVVPGPHKIWVANPELSKTIVPIGEYFQKKSTLTKAEIEIVTNLINARWRSAYASYEHEKIGTEQGHLAPDILQRLIAGLPVQFEDKRQQIVYEIAYALVEPRIVSAALFHRGQDALGDAGLVDISVLIGWFTMVSMTLAVYDVPADALGLDQ